MPLELSPHIRKAVELLGCPHVSSPEKAHEKLMTMLGDAEKQVHELVMDREVPPMRIVRKVARDFLINLRRFSVFFGGESSSGDTTVDVSELCGMLSLLATSATCMLKDMAFLIGAGASWGCDSCPRDGECTKGIREKDPDDEDPEEG